MAVSERASVSSARWLVVVIGAVTLSFLLETAVTQRFEGDIEVRADAIVANAIPSVHLLTRALGELDRLDFEIDQYASASAEGQGGMHERMLADERQVEVLFESYASLPLFPHEDVLAAPLRAQLQRLRTRLAQLEGTASPAALLALHHDLDTLQAALRGIVEFDADQGQRLGREIEQIRSRTKGLVAILDGVCVLLAIVAALLALRNLRRTSRTFEQARLAGEKREVELSRRADALGEFSGRVAHDILSPLGTALMSLEMMQAACANEPSTQRTAVLGIRSIKRVQTLVDGLLAFSHAGGTPEPGVTTPLGPTLRALTDDLREAAADADITLELILPQDGPVACSPGVLTSLISNLVRNAIRYMGTATTRRIEVRVIERGAWWRFEVADTGPGIAREDQRKIFEPHVRLAHGGTGIGLGLATVDRLVRAHGGSLGVISNVGEGARFWFELPKAVVVTVPDVQPAPTSTANAMA